jgi:hypothetical protein
MWIATPSFCKCTAIILLINYRSSTLFIMIRKVIALPTLLQPINPTSNPILALTPTSVPLHSPGCSTYISSLTRGHVNFPVLGHFGHWISSLMLLLLLIWPFAVQELLCFVDGNNFGVWKININYCEANIADTKGVNLRYNATIFPPQFLAVVLNRNMLR